MYSNLETLSNNAKLKIFESAPKLIQIQNTPAIKPLQHFRIKAAESNVIINKPEFKKTSLYFVQLIDQVDIINSIKNNLNFTPMCELICGPSRFNIDKSSTNEPTEQFLDFFEIEQNRAFDDFNFRLKLERVTAISLMFPAYIRQFIVDLDNLDQLSETQKIWFSLKAEYSLARFAEHLNRANNVNLKKKIAF